MAGGKNTNSTGKYAEYDFESKIKMLDNFKHITFQKKYTRWYGSLGKIDFYVELISNKKIFIEIKTQNGGGTVEDKFLSSFEDILSSIANDSSLIGILLINNGINYSSQISFIENKINTAKRLTTKQKYQSALNFYKTPTEENHIKHIQKYKSSLKPIKQELIDKLKNKSALARQGKLYCDMEPRNIFVCDSHEECLNIISNF